jgi:hypothetical protein
MGGEFVLQALFGVTGSPLNLWLKFGRRILVQILMKDPAAQVRLPTDEEVQSYKNCIEDLYPLLKDVCCVSDGLKIYIQNPGNANVQNMFYNGWTHDTYVTNVLVFCPRGTVIAASYNHPGSMHDSEIAHWGDIYTKLDDQYERTGGKCVVDSAFCGVGRESVIKSVQDCLNAETALAFF